VFDVTGLEDRFQIVESRPEALARLSSSRDAASPPERSTVTRLVSRLLGVSASPRTVAGPRVRGERSALTREAAVLVARSPARHDAGKDTA
jgi:hypothetical protein